MSRIHPILVGRVGWSLRKEHKKRFPSGDSHLARYSQRFPAVEIDSSFKQDHRPSTYDRWADTVPQDFKFSVKMTRQVTHETRLKDPSLLEDFLHRVTRLGDKLGPLLIQLPPSLEYDPQAVEIFFTALRERFAGEVVCEPRHEGWFDSQPEDILADFEVARVAADPAPAPGADQPAGWGGLFYYRLHGSPVMYYSSYSEDYLKALLAELKEHARSASTWCIFDNTARGAGTENALWLLEHISS
jgi:uncharacterized protein YecE (DUF72 family)